MRENLPTIEQMECFIIYGRAGNFARAAREANITQSAFSAQIKHLECVLGVKLGRGGAFSSPHPEVDGGTSGNRG